MHPTEVQIDPNLLTDPRCRVRLAVRHGAPTVDFLKLDAAGVSQPMLWVRARGVIAAVGQYVEACAIFLGDECDSIWGWRGEYAVIAERFGLDAGEPTEADIPEDGDADAEETAVMTAGDLEALRNADADGEANADADADESDADAGEPTEAEGDADTGEEKSGPITRAEYEAMDKKALDAWAADALGLKLDGRWAEDRMRAAIEADAGFADEVVEG